MKNIHFLPNTKLGKWPVVLIVAMPIFFYIGMSFVSFYESISIMAGKTIPHDIVARPGVALPMLAGFVSGIGAFFTGIIDIIRNKDYSFVVFLSTTLGFLVLIWCLVQFFPLIFQF